MGAPAIADERLAGTVTSTGATELVLAPAKPPGSEPSVLIPLEAIDRLEISLGRHSSAWKGLGLGSLGGAAAGAAFMGIACASEDGSNCGGSDVGTGVRVVYSAVLGAGAGAVLGLIVGSLVKTERWEEVPAAR